MRFLSVNAFQLFFYHTLIFSQHHKELGTTHIEEQIEAFPSCLFTAVLDVLL